MSEMLDDIFTKVSQSLRMFLFFFLLLWKKSKGFMKLECVGAVTPFSECLCEVLRFLFLRESLI